MANIDQLSIEITANADRATRAITNLTLHLNRLSLALKSINTNSISQFAKSIESLSNTGRRTDEVSRNIDKMAKSLSNSFGIRTKEGMDAVKLSLIELADAQKRFQSDTNNLSFGEAFESARSEAEATIKEYARIPKFVDDTTRSIREFVSATNKGKAKISLAEVAGEFGENFSNMRKVLGKNFTAELKATQQGVGDFATFLQELNDATGANFDTSNISNGFEQLVNYLELARTETLSYDDAVKKNSIGMYDALAAVTHYSDALYGIMRLSEGENTNGIDALVDSLSQLSTVQLPDFSPFAETINTLNKISTDKVVKNIQAVKGALDGTLPSADDLKNGLENLENSSKDAMSDLSDMANDSQALQEAGENLNEAAESARELATNLSPINQRVAEIIARIKELKEAMKSIEAGGISNISYGDAVKELQALNKELAQIKKTGEIANDAADLNDNLSEAGENGSQSIKKAKAEIISFHDAMTKAAQIVDQLGRKLGQIGDLGIKGLKLAYSPLANLTKEYREKLGRITGFFKSFRSNIQKELNKLSAFWKRTMKTFTFMLVRKAITAIIDNVKEAVDELALFEMKLGTLSKGQFNTSLSEIIADFHYIGRAIVAAFEPLINFVVPAINAVANALANVLALVGEFFAAFTGQSYFVRARKTVVNYGEELDKNNSKLKEQKKLLLGIDELNVMPSKNDSSGSGGGGVNYKDAFDEKPVSDNMKNLAEKIKGILDQLFAPLKAAWDRVGPYVLHEFNYLWSEIKRLAADIGRDFLTMWNEPETQRILESILRTVGNLAGGLGNLVYNFRQAWEDYGLGIFEKLRDNLGILQGWVEKTSWAFKNWTRDVHFDNLLSAIDQLLIKTKELSNFIGGVFYDVMTNVVMKYVEWLIEQGIPHLITTIGEVIDAFDFDKIRSDLQILEVAFEHMAEQIDEGITNAIGNVGKALAEWMNSDEFTEFCNSLAYFMDLITAERVEKLFTALGIGLVDTAKGLASFVSSDGFKSFVDKIIEWYDSKSAEEIAGYLEKIAAAIALFKFAEFVAPGVAGFLNFIATISTLTSLGQIAKDLGILASGTEAVGTAAGAAGASTGGFAASLGAIAAPVAIIIAALATLTASFGGIKGLIEELSRRVGELKTHFEDILNRAFIPMEGAIGTLKASFTNFTASLGSFRGAWVLVLDILQTIVSVIGGTLMGAISGIVTAIGGAITFISGVINVVGGVLSTVAGVVQGFIGIIQLIVGTITGNQAIVDNALKTIQKSFEALGQGVTAIGTGISQAFEGAFTFVIGLLSGFVNGVIEFFKGLKYNLLGDPIVVDMVNGIITWFQTLFTDASKAVSDLVTAVIGFFSQLLTDAVAKAGEIKEKVVGKFEELKTNAKTKIDTFKTNTKKAFEETVRNVTTKAQEIAKKVSDGIKDIPKNTKDKFDTVKNNIKDKLEESIEKVSDKLTKMKQKFERFKLENVAKNIIRGFTSGLRSAWSDVISWANQAIADLKKKFQEGLQIHSPSKVFEKYGEYVVEGFNQGITEFQDSTGKTVDKWIANLTGLKISLSPDVTETTVSASDVIGSNSSYGSGLTRQDLVEVLNDFAARYLTRGENQKIVLEMNGRKLYEEMIRENKQHIMRTGKSSFAY